MNLYLIHQSANKEYDTFDSAVVAAESETQAQHTFPRDTVAEQFDLDGKPWWECTEQYGPLDLWTHPLNVTVIYLGTTELPAGVICASFRAA